MNKKSFTLYTVLWLGISCLLLAVFGLFIFAQPALASIINTLIPTPEILWASVYVPKPSIAPPDVQVAAPTESIAGEPNTPSQVESETPAEPSSPTDTPGMELDIVDNSSQDSSN